MRKVKGLFGLVSASAAVVSAVSGFRAARADSDRLALANAVASVAVAITGAALAVRGLRKKGLK